MEVTTLSDGTLARPQPILPNAVFGMLVFVLTEAMYFCALVSAFLVIRAGSGSAWELPAGVRLPVLATGFSTLVLLASGMHMEAAVRVVQRSSDRALRDTAQRWMGRAVLLGMFFLIFQGLEWSRLLKFGLSMSGQIFGACFFLIIGSHALHVAGALGALIWGWRRLVQGTLTSEAAGALRVLWWFVVGVWPVLYGLVYF